MYKIYGSAMCPDCRECKVNYDAYKIPYEYIDINEALPNLKEFLKLRDTEAVFDAAREAGGIGIPAIVKEDGTVTLDWEGILQEKGLEVIYREGGMACSIDKKGC